MKKRPIRQYLKRAELTALIKAAKKNPRDYALVTLIYVAALRASEPGRLTLEDTRILHEGLLYIHRGKGSREGFIELTATTILALAAWIDFAYPDKKKRTPKSWLFPGQRHRGIAAKGITRFGVYKIIAGLGEDVGLNPALAHPHILKHTRVMDLYDAMVESGGHPYEAIPSVAKLVGHREAKTTLNYYLTEKAGQRRAVLVSTENIVKGVASGQRTE